MTDNTTIEEKPKRRSVSQKDLDAFKKEMCQTLDDRFDAFIDDFMAAWDEATPSEESDKDCNCSECNQEEQMPENPRRYLIQAGGNTWWVDNYKLNSFSGIDVIWTEELGGKLKTVRGVITSPDASIFDFENTEITPEIFESIKRQTTDYMIHVAQEAQAKEKAMKATQTDQTIDSSSHVSYG
jgi:hypothetical protein